MPELPEVETTRLGIRPHIEGRPLLGAVVRQQRLRWPVPARLGRLVCGQRLLRVGRRGKYLLLELEHGTLLLHLGMSGSLRILPPDTPAGVHDHLDLLFPDCLLRLRDPRRFGAVLWTREPADRHPLLRHLGPEPLDPAFDGAVLHHSAARRRVAVKNLIMDGRVVVGVGNIYASEALFLSGIHPARACNRVSRQRYDRLAEQIGQVLEAAIRRGGTTLRDFQQEDGRPGYFTQELQVYGREGQACPRCEAPILQRRIGQRSSFYCRYCQR